MQHHQQISYAALLHGKQHICFDTTYEARLMITLFLQLCQLTFWVAWSSDRLGVTITLFPFCQFTGVATEYLAVSCKLSMTLKTCVERHCPL